MSGTFLLDNISVNTDGSVVSTQGLSNVVAVWATSFGGGTVTIESSPDGGTTWLTLKLGGGGGGGGGNDATFTANGMGTINRVGQGMSVRATLTGSTAASGVNAKLFD